MRAHARGADGVDDDRRHRQRQAQLGAARHPARQAARAQAHAEARSRRRCATALKPIPGIEMSLGERPIYVALLGPDPPVLEVEVQKLADKVAQGPGHRRPRDLGQAGPAGLRGAAEARRGARARPDADRSWRPACAPSSTATSRPTGPRPTASRSRSSCGCRRPRARTSRSSTSCRSPTRRTARRSRWRRVADIVPVINPEVIKRQDLQRRQAIYAGVQGRPSGDVGAEVQKIVKETAAAAGLPLRRRRPDQGPGRRPSPACWRRSALR